MSPQELGRSPDDTHFLEEGDTIRRFVENQRTPTLIKFGIHKSLDEPPSSYLYICLIPPEGTMKGDRIRNVPGSFSYMVYGSEGREKGLAEGHQLTKEQYDRLNTKVQEELDKLHAEELLKDVGL